MHCTALDVSTPLLHFYETTYDPIPSACTNQEHKIHKCANPVVMALCRIQVLQMYRLPEQLTGPLIVACQ